MPARCWIAPDMPTATIEVGRHDLAGLPDLQIVGHEAGIDRRARSAHGGAQFVGDRLESFLKFSPDASPRPPEMMMRADASSGRSDFVSSAFSNDESPTGCRGRDHSRSRAEPPFGRRRERRCAHRDDLLGFGGLHRLDGVAGIDRPLERVGAETTW